MGIKIKDTEHVKEIKYEQMIAVGNVDTNDARHINVGNLSDFVENNIKMNGTFATSEQLQGVYSAISDLTGGITSIDEKYNSQLITVGQQIATLETQTNNYETWVFELEDGTTINKNILIK